MAPKNIVLAFDAYGTLLSTESIAKELADHFGEEKAQTITATWRKYQLEYTWRLNSMGQYEDFSHLTLRSLKHALAESSLSLQDKQLEGLMQAYDSLSIFPDVAPCLQSLKSSPDITAYVFSNGTHSMVSNSVNKSPSLSSHAHIFKGIVVADAVKRFKPAPEAYNHLAKTVGKSQKQMNEVWLISGNPFDIVGARAVGLNAVWVDRAGTGWQDELVHGAAGRPTEVVKTFAEVVRVVMGSAADELTGQWRELPVERDT